MMILGTWIVMCPIHRMVAPPAVPQPTVAAAASSDEDLLGLAVALAFMGLCSLVYAITRATAVRRTFATSRHRTAASLELLRAVVLRQRTRALAFAAACFVAGVALTRLPVASDVRVLLAITPMLMLGVALVSAWKLQGLAAIHTDPGLDISVHGPFLYVARSGHLVGWVAAPPRIVADVSALPLARLRQ